jgi:starch synthase
VARDLPAALTRLGWTATVVTPAYGAFHKIDGALPAGEFTTRFRGTDEIIQAFEVPSENAPVRNIVFEHPGFSPQGPGRVYCSDPDDMPFATDADKFALFSASLADWLLQADVAPSVLHLHDWHTGFYFLLREYGTRYAALRKLRTVFTIHNLAYQGTRPFSGHSSSLDAWFPGLTVEHDIVRDPSYADCINPMATAIRIADRISTVSPTYANEICEPSDPRRGFIGGEGLENDLQRRRNRGDLVGILNGCEYPRRRGRKPAWQTIVAQMHAQAEAWQERGDERGYHALATKRLATLPKRKPRNVLVSIGRLVDQKVSLMFEPLADKRPALEHLLTGPGREALLVLLGSGDAMSEGAMYDIAARNENLVFLCGYAEHLAAPLYRSGDLFLMPSSFEPCGISQLLSMRAGVPCVVHAVGGLRDTVDDGRTGFAFGGSSPRAQATNFVAAVDRALEFKSKKPKAWTAMRAAARAVRFDWARAARDTVARLYDA